MPVPGTGRADDRPGVALGRCGYNGAITRVPGKPHWFFCLTQCSVVPVSVRRRPGDCLDVDAHAVTVSGMRSSVEYEHIAEYCCGACWHVLVPEAHRLSIRSVVTRTQGVVSYGCRNDMALTMSRKIATRGRTVMPDTAMVQVLAKAALRALPLSACFVSCPSAGHLHSANRGPGPRLFRQDR